MVKLSVAIPASLYRQVMFDTKNLNFCSLSLFMGEYVNLVLLRCRPVEFSYNDWEQEKKKFSKIWMTKNLEKIKTIGFKIFFLSIREVKKMIAKNIIATNWICYHEIVIHIF